MGDVGEISGVQLLGFRSYRVGFLLEQLDDVGREQSADRRLVVVANRRVVGGSFHGASGRLRLSTVPVTYIR